MNWTESRISHTCRKGDTVNNFFFFSHCLSTDSVVIVILVSLFFRLFFFFLLDSWLLTLRVFPETFQGSIRGLISGHVHVPTCPDALTTSPGSENGALTESVLRYVFCPYICRTVHPFLYSGGGLSRGAVAALLSCVNSYRYKSLIDWRFGWLWGHRWIVVSSVRGVLIGSFSVLFIVCLSCRRHFFPHKTKGLNDVI